MSGYGNARSAIPKVRCADVARHSGRPCRGWAKPGLRYCHKHRRASDVERAEAHTTLATIAHSRGVPVWDVVLDAVDYAQALMAECAEPVDRARATGDSATSTLDPDTVDRHIQTFRLAHKLATTAITTGAVDRATTVQERRTEVEAQYVAALVEHAVRGVTDWLADAGLSEPDTTVLKRWVGLRLRRALAVANDHPDGAASLRAALAADDSEPRPSNLDRLVILPRAEVESMRNELLRLRPAISDRPADVTPPAESVPASLRPAHGSAHHARPPSVGLLGTPVTRRYAHRTDPSPGS